MNAVSAVRRLAALLQLLGLPAGALHAQQQQRQRLKALDRFKAHPHGVLVATDVAARGLDIPDVQVGRLKSSTTTSSRSSCRHAVLCWLLLSFSRCLFVGDVDASAGVCWRQMAIGAVAQLARLMSEQPHCSQAVAAGSDCMKMHPLLAL